MQIKINDNLEDIYSRRVVNYEIKYVSGKNDGQKGSDYVGYNNSTDYANVL